MVDRTLIRLQLAHDFYAPAPPPVQAAAPAGLVIRSRAGHVTVIAPDRFDAPARINLDLLWDSLDFCMITDAYEWSRVPVLEVPADVDQVPFGRYPVSRSIPRGLSDRRVVRLEIAVTPDTARDIQLGFGAVAAHWTYHLLGGGLRDDLEVVDMSGQTRFDDLGFEILPDGARARVLRSTEPLALHTRPTQRFALQYQGQFGPVVLVPALPTASANIRPVADDRDGGRFQADIYVTLN